MNLDVTPALYSCRHIYWPTIAHDSHEVFHTVYIQGRPVAYVLTQLKHECLIPHIYIPQENRSRKVIDHIKKVFHDLYIPEFRSRGYTEVVTTCDVEDIKTQELLKYLGFTSKNVHVATLSIRD